jgi:hypothetical protein
MIVFLNYGAAVTAQRPVLGYASTMDKQEVLRRVAEANRALGRRPQDYRKAADCAA